MPNALTPTCVPGLCALYERLCAQSIRDYRPPFEFPGWPTDLDPDQWYTSPELISLAGLPLWDSLSRSQQQTVGFWEAVNFFSANIHGEASLMRGLADRLYRSGHNQSSPYLHHMIDEENKHSVYFAEFCRRYGGKIYPDRMLTLAADPAESADFLFFVRVLIFEDVVDAFNSAMGADRRLAPVARWINASHHQDERRHLAFGRNRVKELFDEGRERWTAGELEYVRSAVVAYLNALWVPMYNPAVYVDAGLPDPYALARSAFASPFAQRLRTRLSRRSVSFLLRLDILDERPDL